MDWQTFLSGIETGDKGIIETALWGRDRIQGENNEGVPGIGRIFVGHTPRWGGLRRYGNVYAIDTGAVFGDMGLKVEGCLTMANLLAGTDCLTRPRQVKLVDVINPGLTPGNPFGQYATNQNVLLDYLRKQPDWGKA